MVWCHALHVRLALMRSRMLALLIGVQEERRDQLDDRRMVMNKTHLCQLHKKQKGKGMLRGNTQSQITLLVHHQLHSRPRTTHILYCT